METATELKIDELDRYINGLQNDLRAVKNAIIYPYNNGCILRVNRSVFTDK